MQDLDIINISDEQANKAKLLASGMSEPIIRKRGMIDMLGIGCAVNYLYLNKIRIDTRKSVHKIPLLFEEFKITDIYHNNYRIDVITLYKEKTVKIPKIHVDLDIMPHFYFIVQIGSKIKEAKMIGFIDSKNIPMCSHDSKFYYPTLDLLFNIKKFSSVVRHSIPDKTLLGKHIECMGLFLKFIDNDLSSAYKKQLIQHLMNCDACRERFINVMEFEKLAKNMKYYPDLIKKLENAFLTPENEAEFNKVMRKKALKKPPVKKIPQIPLLEEKEDIPQVKPVAKQNKAAIQKALLEAKYAAKGSSLASVIMSKGDLKQKSIRIIDSIFNDIPKIELPPLSVLMDAKNKRTVMIAIAIVFVFTSFAIISFTGSDNSIEGKISPDTEQESIFEGTGPGLYNLPPATGEARLIPKQRSIDDFIINAPGVSTNSGYTPTITRLTWEAPESIVKKEAYTKYLQLIGKNIKLNLQNDLLLVNDVPMNKVVKTDIKIGSNGDVHSIKVSQSSGSEAIDASIEKTVNETLTYMKPPSHGILSRTADITLTIDLR